MSTGKADPEKRPFVIAAIVSQATMRAVRKLFAEVENIDVRSIALKALASPPSGSPIPNVLLLETLDSSDYSFQTSLQTIRKDYPAISVVVLTPAPDYSSAVSLIRDGVMDYCAFPLDARKLFDSITGMYTAWMQEVHQKQFISIQQSAYDFSQIVGTSPQLQSILRLVQKVIRSDYLTTLILGETGTGKELLAKAIHYNSSNREFPFVEIGCSAIPETLLESELFGYERGAFTDAREKKIGLFELASHGTIFLDEIGDITPITQSKLLKVIEEKKMRRIGGFADITVEARIIAATSRNLEDLVRKGHFRQDLYYRLKILPLHLPPLRERENDILLLAEHFLALFNTRHHKNVHGFTENAKQMLRRHRWQGNIRELRHSVERAVVLTDEEWINEKDFDLTFELYNDSYFASSPSAGNGDSSDNSTLTLTFTPENATIAQMEARLAQEVLKRVDGNKSQAAQVLGISRPRLDRILKKNNN